MPTISMFYGIIIRMYADDHNPPHFHALYQGQEAAYTTDGELLEGSLPKKQTKLILAWADLHKDELDANWELMLNGEPAYKIEPLR